MPVRYCLCRHGNQSINSHPSLLHLSCRGSLFEGCFMLLLFAGGWPAQGQAGVWVLTFFYAQSNNNDVMQQFHFHFLSLFSCFQALWQRWQRGPWQLCKLLSKIRRCDCQKTNVIYRLINSLFNSWLRNPVINLLSKSCVLRQPHCLKYFVTVKTGSG